ncbi:hypothetical protein [Solilutibacter silvestris]|uniref:hypothetical protein n=1 Tax=Solilutibacter silvestris TaxID=1645665 RepID=UPI003D34F7C1
MKTSLLAAGAFAAVLLSGCVTDAPRTSLRPGGTYDPDARVRAAEMESDRPVIIVPYGMYGYPGPYYYGGGFGYGAYGYGSPWYGGYYGPGPVFLPPRHHHRPSQPSGQAKTPNNPPRTFRDLFPGAKR